MSNFNIYSKKIICITILVALFCLGLGCNSMVGGDKEKTMPDTGAKVIEQAITMTIGHDTPEKGFVDKGIVNFKEILEEKTDGRINIEIYPGGQLSGGDSFVSMNMLKDGDMDAGLIMPGIFARTDPRVQILNFPFLFEDSGHAFRVWDGNGGKYVLDLLSEHGYKGLSYFFAGTKVITNSKRPLASPDDAKGLKMRSADAPILIEWYKALGATPSATPMGELFIALQQGVVDGQDNAIGTSYDRGFHEVQKYLTITGHEYVPYILAVNKAFFDSLPVEMQDDIISSAKEAALFERQIVMDEEEAYLEKYEKAGVEIKRLSTEEKVAWIKNAQPVREKFKDVVGEETYNKIINN